MDIVGSIRYDVVWGRGLETGTEDLGFKHAGNPEDIVPSIHTTVLLDICIYETYSNFGKVGMRIAE